MNILQINSSAKSSGSESSRVASNIVNKLLAANPGATVEVRDLAANPHPVLDEATLQALLDETGAACWAPDPPSDGPCQVE